MGAKIIRVLFRTSVVLYALLSGYYFLTKPAGGGDESLFISDLQLIQTDGWVTAISKGISITYMALSYPLTFLLESHIALRAVNVLVFAALLFYFYKRFKIKELNFYLLLLFFYSTVGYFMAGTNDTMFVVPLVLFICETYYLLTTTKARSLAALGCALILSVFTRELIILFLPVVVLAVILLIRKKKGSLKSLGIPVLLLLIGLLVNLPSLQTNGRLSYDQKLPPDGVLATWPQRQYLAQLLVNEGKLKNYNHPDWQQTDAYLIDNGETSLPKSVGEGIFFNPALTVKEFFKDAVYSVAYGSRQLGLMLPTLLILGVLSLFKFRKIDVKDFIPLTVLGVICTFSFLIISYVELRWLAPVFIAGIFYFYTLEQRKTLPSLLVNANYIFIGLLSWYGAYGIITKL